MKRCKAKRAAKTRQVGSQTRPLTEKQRAFAMFFATVGSETEGQSRKSAEKAGYSLKSAPCTGSQLAKKPHVAAEIARIQEAGRLAYAGQVEISVALLRQEFLNIAESCKAAKDTSNALRALEDLAKTIGAFSEGVTLDVSALQAYAERERLEARRLSRLLISDQKEQVDTTPHEARDKEMSTLASERAQIGDAIRDAMPASIEHGPEPARATADDLAMIDVHPEDAGADDQPLIRPQSGTNQHGQEHDDDASAPPADDESAPQQEIRTPGNPPSEGCNNVGTPSHVEPIFDFSLPLPIPGDDQSASDGSQAHEEAPGSTTSGEGPPRVSPSPFVDPGSPEPLRWSNGRIRR